MSKAEHMGISSSQVSYHSKSHSCPKQMTPEQTHECTGLSEQIHQHVPETIQTEPGNTCTAVSQHAASQTLQTSSELATRNSLTDDLNPLPEDACKSSWTGSSSPKLTGIDHKLEFGSKGVHSEFGAVCAHSERETCIVQNEPTASSSAPSSCLVNETLQQLPEDVGTLSEDLGLPQEDTSKSSQIDTSSCSQQTMSGQTLQFPSDGTSCELSDERQKPGSELERNESVKFNTGISSYMAIQHLEPVPETFSYDQANIPANEQLGPPHDDVDKHSKPEHLETPSKDVVTNSCRIGRRVKRTPKLSRKKYMLRSLKGSDRVLRSRSKETPKVPESSNNLGNVDSSGKEKRKKKKKRRGRRIEDDEYLKIRKHLRYLLNRISYEQSLITAYSAEGWKGLSLEKLKPEKELQRATSEIFRRKLDIRNLFQRIDSLCAEGRLPASLFDSEGQISSEDIFCAKCGSKDLTADNDIILCDGSCDRGFHQFCLVPPLLKEDIPPDDEGWLCPGCDCKVDCIELLNDNQGTNIAINDSWEKVFPEAAAAAAAGKNLDHNFGLPSDDSDDNDYNPDGPEIDEKSQGDESSSDESDFTSASDESEAPPGDEQHVGLPSDDSEDDDYDPDAPDIDEKVKQESSSSDFTSDSEDLAVALDNSKLSGKDGSHSSVGPHVDTNGQRSKLGGKKMQSLNSELLSILQPDLDQDASAAVSGKRNIERLDYKKLYDETYGNVSSDSSDDEDYTDTDGPRKRRKKSTDNVAPVAAKGNSPVTKSGTSPKDINETECTPKRRTRQRSNLEDPNASPAKAHEGTPNSSDKRARSSVYRRLGEAVTQGLYNSFKENQYPDRATKESLAKDLGITLQQVSKWFENARWSFHHSLSKGASIAKSTSEKDSPVPKTTKSLLEPGPESVTCNGAASEEPSKVGVTASVAENCGGDTRDNKLENQEISEQKLKTWKSRRR